MPVVDDLSIEYGDRVAFVAPAWKGTAEATAQRAAELMGWGNIQWGLDEGEKIFQAYGVPYQPVTVLIGANKTIVDVWAGIRPKAEVKAALDAMLAAGT